MIAKLTRGLVPLTLTITMVLVGGCRFDGSGLQNTASDRGVDVYDPDLVTIQPPECGATDAFASNCVDCPLGCVPQRDRCVEFPPSNLPPSALHQGSGLFTINGNITINTTEGTIRGPNGEVTLPSGHGVYTSSDHAYLVYYGGSLTIAQGAKLRLVGKRPLIIAASDTVTIAGTIDLSAQGRNPGAGGGVGGNAKTSGQPAAGSVCEQSSAGEARGSQKATGGAGGSFGGHGGAGGHGPPGRAPCKPQLLKTLVGGTGGGGGARTGGAGGGGGGALQISAWRTIVITVTGTIHAGGGGGEGGKGIVFGFSGSGGGGGSGGAILLEAPTVENSGTLLANGGGGGGGGAGWVGTDDGDDGDDAPPDGGLAQGGDGGTIVIAKGGKGGEGAGAGQLDGGPGEFQDAKGGGGGGSVGVIHINTADGTIAGNPKLVLPTATQTTLTKP